MLLSRLTQQLLKELKITQNSASHCNISHESSPKKGQLTLWLREGKKMSILQIRLFDVAKETEIMMSLKVI